MKIYGLLLALGVVMTLSSCGGESTTKNEKTDSLITDTTKHMVDTTTMKFDTTHVDTVKH